MTIVSRRAVLTAGAGALGLLALGVQAPSAQAALSPLPARSHYKSSVGKTFTATRGKDTYQLKLVRISDVTGAIAKQRELSFMLIFDVVGASPMPDGIYTVRRFGARTHALFMSAIGAPRSMQALMNRSV